MTDMKNFIYNGMNVRTAVVNGESWFVAADICRILDIGNPSDALSRLDDDEKNTLVLTEGIPGNPEKRVVNEAGLYTLILRSRKPEARAFKRWVTHEVLPAIRKTGIYATEAILDNPDLAIAALTKLKEKGTGTDKCRSTAADCGAPAKGYVLRSGPAVQGSGEHIDHCQGLWMVCKPHEPVAP